MTVEAGRTALEESGRRLPLLLAVVVLAVAGGLGFLAYRTWFGGGGEGQPEYVTEPVARATIRSTIATSGVVEAVDQVVLRFTGAGRVRETLVQLGQEVKRGDPLVSLEDDALRNRLSTAQSNLATAQIRLSAVLKGASEAELAAADQAVVSAETALGRARRDLEDLKEGPSAAEVSAAQQAVVSAQTARDRAQRELEDLRDRPTASDLASAEQAVATADASLASARAKYDQLTAGASAAELEAAESAVASAQQSLASANTALENGRATAASAEAALRAAGANYCSKVTDDAVCSPFVVPLPGSAVSDLLGRLSDPATDVTLLDEINALIQTNAAYITATNSLETARGAVTSAQAALEAANARLAALRDEPPARDVEAARAAVVSAEASLDAALLKLDDLRAGADPSQIATAQDALRSAQVTLDAAVAKRDDLMAGADASQIATAEDAVRSAEAALESAIAKRDDVLGGADPEDVDLARQQVRLAQLSVEAARHDVDEAVLRAPFDGTVGALNVRPGDLAGPTVEIVTLLTPGAMKVALAAGETDFPNIRAGMAGVILFDAIQGKPFPILVSAVNLAPDVQQGVVTYTVEASLLGLEGEGPKPAPGMNGAAILVSEQRSDVLSVPNRAIRRRGEDLVVDVLVDGVVQPRVIKTGLADSEMTEVTEGLEEGEEVVVGTVQPGQPSSQPTPQRLPAGVR